MSDTANTVILFPHQLFEAVLKNKKIQHVLLVEDDLYFKQYAFHKQKLILHRASMKAYADALKQNSKHVDYIESGRSKSMNVLRDYLKQKNITAITYYDVVDDWLEQRLHTVLDELDISYEVHASPAFLTSRGAIDDYFSDHPNRMQSFYEWQRKRLDVLLENDKPTGGKWSYDDHNRKPLPKKITLPQPYTYKESTYVIEATDWVKRTHNKNPGSTNFAYPITHIEAHDQLEQFLSERFELFGPYEDAIAQDEGQLFHSALSSSLNIGLITPTQVVTRTLQFAKEHDTPLASVEGFIRQIIGWREYMRATYVQHGRAMRSQNKLEFTTSLPKSWWDGSTGLTPIDTTITRVLDTAYAHHIERLMILGNAMVLLRIRPDDVYEWFMSLFIDAYDWVMVPNVYAMSQFAAGDMITTKPYVSGSNYIVKMSDYKKQEWAEVWDALYWRFIDDYREVFESNYRSAMMVKLYDKQSPEKKRNQTRIANEWLKHK